MRRAAAGKGEACRCREEGARTGSGGAAGGMAAPRRRWEGVAAPPPPGAARLAWRVLGARYLPGWLPSSRSLSAAV